MAYTLYRKVARDALVTWNGYSEEAALEAITTKSVDYLETKEGEYGGVKAKESVNAAINKIAETLGLNEQEKADLIEAVYGTDEAVELSEKNIQALKALQEKAKGIENTEEFILDVLFAVHDRWVVVYDYQFEKPGREARKYQHLPSELIGWKEQKSDLLFAKPLCEALGIEVNEAKLEKAYNQRVKNYFKDNKLTNKDALIEHILNVDYEARNEKNTPKTREEAALMADQVAEKVAPALKDRETGDGGRV